MQLADPMNSKPALQRLRLNAINEYTQRAQAKDPHPRLDPHLGAAILRSTSCRTAVTTYHHVANKDGPAATQSGHVVARRSPSDAKQSLTSPQTSASARGSFTSPLKFATPKRVSVFRDPSIEVLSPIPHVSESPVSSPIVAAGRSTPRVVAARKQVGRKDTDKENKIEIVKESTDLSSSLAQIIVEDDQITTPSKRPAADTAAKTPSMLGELADAKSDEESDGEGDALLSPFKFAARAHRQRPAEKTAR